MTAAGSLGKLYLDAKTVELLSQGKAAISAYMSHHGLAHCVLPKAVALGLAEVFPLWLRQLKGHPEAGKLQRDESKASSVSETTEQASRQETPPEAEKLQRDESTSPSTSETTKQETPQSDAGD